MSKEWRIDSRRHCECLRLDHSDTRENECSFFKKYFQRQHQAMREKCRRKETTTLIPNSENLLFNSVYDDIWSREIPFLSEKEHALHIRQSYAPMESVAKREKEKMTNIPKKKGRTKTIVICDVAAEIDHCQNNRSSEPENVSTNEDINSPSELNWNKVEDTDIFSGKYDTLCDFSGKDMVAHHLEEALRFHRPTDTILLSYNSLTHLPPSFPHTLRVLQISHNLIAIPTEFKHFKKLEELDLSYNKLSSTLGISCPCLIILQLSNNCLRRIEGLESLRSLRTLDLSKNLLKSTYEIRALSINPALQSLNLDGNPICNTPGYKFTMRNFFPKVEIVDIKQKEEFYKKKQIVLQNKALPRCYQQKKAIHFSEKSHNSPVSINSTSTVGAHGVTIANSSTVDRERYHLSIYREDKALYTPSKAIQVTTPKVRKQGNKHVVEDIQTRDANRAPFQAYHMESKHSSPLYSDYRKAEENSETQSQISTIVFSCGTVESNKGTGFKSKDKKHKCVRCEQRASRIQGKSLVDLHLKSRLSSQSSESLLKGQHRMKYPESRESARHEYFTYSARHLGKVSGREVKPQHTKRYLEEDSKIAIAALDELLDEMDNSHRPRKYDNITNCRFESQGNNNTSLPEDCRAEYLIGEANVVEVLPLHQCNARSASCEQLERQALDEVLESKRKALMKLKRIGPKELNSSKHDHSVN